MASRKSNEQAITWLRSMAADKNSLDGINAELVLYILEEKDRQYKKLGAQYSILTKRYDQLKSQYDDYVRYGESALFADLWRQNK